MGSMERLRIKIIIVAAASMAVASAQAVAQQVREVPAVSPKTKVVHVVEKPVPFSLDGHANTNAIEFRSVDQMSPKDRELADDAQSSIGELAERVGLAFNEGRWNYQQLVCPALPNHVFLQFSRNNGTRDVSIFSASIPRSGEGKVRVIPILLRSYSLFSPAPISALTISVFNHIRDEEHFDAAPEWLGTGLCYAALSGVRPQVALLEKNTTGIKSRVAMPAGLAIQKNGNVIFSFADVSAVPRPMQWTMIFDMKGRLLKATHERADWISAKAVDPTPIVVKNTVSPVNSSADPAPSN